MKKISVIKNGISKETEKVTNSIQEFKSTGEFEKTRPYNVIDIDLELSEVGAHIESSMENITNELVKYYRRNGAKNIKIRNCWCTSDKIFNGLRNKEYYAGWIEIECEKEIKKLDRMVNNLDKKLYELVEAENKKMEEEVAMISVEDIIIDHIEEMEREFPNKGNIADIVTNAIMDYSGDWLAMHSADRFDYLYDLLAGESEKVKKEQEQMKKIKFNPELTAIDTRNSKSAEMILEFTTEETKILDYGCGTGRNIKYIKNNSPARVDGCDIPEQLEKEKEKHSKLIDKRTVIAPAIELEKESYDVVLNSHVLNVIESDEVKKIVVADIFQKLKNGGKAIIEVRTKQDVEGAKTKEKYGDGWKIKKGSSFTYQEGITKEKMVNLLSNIGFKIEEHTYNSSRHIVVASK